MRPEMGALVGKVRRMVDPGGTLDIPADSIQDHLDRTAVRRVGWPLTAETVGGVVKAYVSGVTDWDDSVTLYGPDGVTEPTAPTEADSLRGRWEWTTGPTTGLSATGFTYDVMVAAADTAEATAGALGAGLDFTTAGGESFNRSGAAQRLRDAAKGWRARAQVRSVPVNMSEHYAADESSEWIVR